MTDLNFRTWQWPASGPTAVNYGLDTEIFDSEKFPHAQTFVREAIQNSLDARLDKYKPVSVRFSRFSDTTKSRAQYLENLRIYKKSCGLSWPEQWPTTDMSWLVVEDSNTSGLQGNLQDRTSDFWNYWLNFGISNKTGSGRGGRGIGRITFLIASGVSTVIGVTRRADDGILAACGMSLLKPGMIDGEFKTSYAYLAQNEAGNVFELYDDAPFLEGLVDDFGIKDYTREGSSGLSLIIPFPHSSLTRDKLIAAAIEHFAPAIISGTLILQVDDQTVDHKNIDEQAKRIAAEFPKGPLQEDPTRLLSLIRHSNDTPDHILEVTQPALGIVAATSELEREALRQKFLTNERLSLEIQIPLARHGKTTKSSLKVSIAHTPIGRKPADLFFREGMCLPEVIARTAADVDLVIQANQGELVSYLNFCEGKAHLGLIENKEVKEKLSQNGFDGGYIIKRFVRRLMDDLRVLVLPDSTKPDASVFSSFFSLPRKDAEGRRGEARKGHQTKNPPPLPPIPPQPKKPQIFLVDEIPGGLRVRANTEQQSWPAHMRMEVVFADGSRNPKWNTHDFDLKKLSTSFSNTNIKPEIRNNVIIVRDCGPDFKMEIVGFDDRRELIASVRGFRNA